MTANNRRQFLKMIGSLAIGTTLAGCGSEGPGAGTETETGVVGTETVGEETPTDTEVGGAEIETETETEIMTGTETASETETETTIDTETETITGTETPTQRAAGNETTTTGAEQITTSYRLGGRVEAWMGQEPQAIADTENPTLELTAGQQYEVTWENLDGQPHNFTIQDSEGSEIVSTEQMSQQGATRSLTFTAEQSMVQYICTVHPNTMVGDIQIS